MSNLSKKILMNYVKEQKFNNPSEVSESLKSLSKDVLQEAWRNEMDSWI